MRRLTACIAALLLLPGLTGCERAKTQFDREVDRLCAIDGGVHVYEKVVLPKENFDSQGRLTYDFFQKNITFKDKSSHQYRIIYQSDEISRKNQFLLRTSISLTKNVEYVERRTDGKIYGKMIWYGRRGGDFFGPWLDSGYSCPSLSISLLKSVFILGD